MASLNTSYMVNGTSALKAEHTSGLVLVAGGKSEYSGRSLTLVEAQQRIGRSSSGVARASRARSQRCVRRIEPLPEPVAATPVLDSNQELAATLGLLGAIAVVVLGAMLLGAIL